VQNKIHTKKYKTHDTHNQLISILYTTKNALY